jgi:hypothetical protein
MKYIVTFGFQHLMNEWLHEKSQDVVPVPLPSPAKTEPLEVNVEDDTMFVTCLPSPRNAMEHLRRNSHSSGTFRPVVNVESSIGSAKKVKDNTPFCGYSGTPVTNISVVFSYLS